MKTLLQLLTKGPYCPPGDKKRKRRHETLKGSEWDESEHPRHPKGSDQGGQFAPKGGASSLGTTYHHSSKPPNWGEVAMLPAEVEEAHRDSMGRLPVAELADNPMRDQFNDEAGPEFIGQRAGQWYHIDTSGYKYARYVARLRRDPRIPAAVEARRKETPAETALRRGHNKREKFVSRFNRRNVDKGATLADLLKEAAPRR